MNACIEVCFACCWNLSITPGTLVLADVQNFVLSFFLLHLPVAPLSSLSCRFPGWSVYLNRAGVDLRYELTRLFILSPMN